MNWLKNLKLLNDSSHPRTAARFRVRYDPWCGDHVADEHVRTLHFSTSDFLKCVIKIGFDRTFDFYKTYYVWGPISLVRANVSDKEILLYLTDLTLYIHVFHTYLSPKLLKLNSIILLHRKTGTDLSETISKRWNWSSISCLIIIKNR